jgi:hypothetical protein
MSSMISRIVSYGKGTMEAGGKELTLTPFDKDAPTKYPPGTIMKFLIDDRDGKTVTAFVRPSAADLEVFNRTDKTAPITETTQSARKQDTAKPQPAGSDKKATGKAKEPPVAAPEGLSKEALAMFTELSTAPIAVWNTLRTEKPLIFEQIIKQIPLPTPVAGPEDATKDMRKLIGSVAKADPKFVTDMFDREPQLMQALVKNLRDATGTLFMDPASLETAIGAFPTERELLEMSKSSEGYWRAKFYLDLSAKAEIRDAVRGKIWGYAVARASRIVLHAVPPASKSADEILAEIVRVAKEIIKMRNATILQEVPAEAP